MSPTPKPRPRGSFQRLFSVLICVAAITLGALASASSVFSQGAPPAIIGQHIVQSGDTLSCIGRAYGVLPRAIAEANGLDLSALLSPGQVLNIPAVQWINIPPGPVCTPQFVSPFPGLTATNTPVSLPPATPTPAAAFTIVGRHVVRSGETVFCIGRAYGVLPAAILQANGLTGSSLSPDQGLNIPAVQWVSILPGPACTPQFASPFPGLPTVTSTLIRTPPAVPAAIPAIGQHLVQKGETLFCVGRAYGVLPTAIAQANNLVSPFRVSPGQVLTIPAVPWAVIPRGLVCRAQFPSPFVSTPTVIPTATSTIVKPASFPTIAFTPTRSRPTPRPTRTPGPTKTPLTP